jgi:hypothetical protein
MGKERVCDERRMEEWIFEKVQFYQMILWSV